MIACTLCGSGDVTIKVHDGTHAKGVTIVRCAHCDKPCRRTSQGCQLCRNVNRNNRDAVA